MSLSVDKLAELHQSLCHPGVTRMAHFVKSRNLPFSIEEIKRMTQSCKTCRECKPQYYRPGPSQLIKATQPFERLSLDFKGPLPTNNRNKFMLTIIDKYSRFPFAFPCQDVSAESIIHCLSQLFSIFGMPAYIHSDRGSGFMSAKLKDFLLQKGISSSRTTPYNPCGNGQVERLNGTLWKAISLALKTRELPTSCWQDVLNDALHSIRSLLCTATDVTPHERLFVHQRRSTSGTSVPTWLTTPGPVLLKRQVRKSKFDPLVDEVELIDANSQYAHVRFPDGREDTVASKYLAPQVERRTEIQHELSHHQLHATTDINEDVLNSIPAAADVEQTVNTLPEVNKASSEEPLSDPQILQRPSPSQQIQPLRRSQRERKPPDRLVYV
jgi:transposase InsO family protein